MKQGVRRMQVNRWLADAIVLVAKAQGNIDDGMHFNDEALRKLAAAKQMIADAEIAIQNQEVNPNNPKRFGGTIWRARDDKGVIR
jgi:hypothetical protein